MLYTLRLFSSSKCSLFHNSNLFGSCIIHFLYTGCAKIKKIIPAPKGYEQERILWIEGESSRSHCVEEPFCKGLWTFRSTDYWWLLLFTFLYTGCANILKNNSGVKRLIGNLYGPKYYLWGPETQRMPISSLALIWYIIYRQYTTTCCYVLTVYNILYNCYVTTGWLLSKMSSTYVLSIWT
jgi:hypothetical protein